MHLDASGTFVAIRLLKCFGLYHDVASKNLSESIFTCESIEPVERRDEVTSDKGMVFGVGLDNKWFRKK